MTLSELRDLLLTITPNVFRYSAYQQPDKYIVWAEDSQGSATHADDNMGEQSIQGTIDYFTKTEFDPTFNTIQEVLNSANISWYLSSIQYEKDTGYIHYEWVWEVDGIGEDGS